MTSLQQGRAAATPEDASHLAERERRLAATIDSLLDPHVLLEPVRGDAGTIVDFVCVAANRAATDYLRLGAGDVVGVRLLQLLPGQVRSGMFDRYVAAVETGEPMVLDDFPLFSEVQGSQRRFDVRAVRVGDALAYTWRDVTERHLAGERLAASERHFRDLADNSLDVILRLDGASRIRWASPSITRALGWGTDDVTGTPLVDLLHPDDLAAIQAAYRHAIDEGEPQRVECRLLSRAGGWEWMEGEGAVLTGDDGTSGAVVSLRSIAAEHAAREALAASEAQFRMLAESIGDVVVAVDTSGRVRWVSPSVRRLLGRDPAALPGTAVGDLVDAADRALVDAALAAGPATGAEHLPAFHVRLLRADGRTVWSDATTTFRRDGSGATAETYLVFHDVDDQVRAETALVESRRHYRLLAEHSADVVLLLDETGRVSWASPSLTRLTGWQPDDLLGASTFDLAHPEDLATVQAARLEVVSGSGQATFQARVRAAAGSWQWLNVVSRAVRGPDGVLTGIVTNWRDGDADVAARTMLESAYDQAAQAWATLQASIDASPDAFAIYDIVRDETDYRRVTRLRLVAMNAAGARPMGYEPDELEGRDVRDFYPEAVRTGLWAAMLAAVDSGAPVSHRDDQVVDGAVVATWDNRITPVGEDRLVNIWRDVTREVRAERALAASETRFRVAMEHAPIAMMLLRDDGAVALANDAAVRMLHYDADVLHRKRLDDLLAEPVGDAALPWNSVGQRAGVTSTRDVRLVTGDGDLRWGQLSVSAVQDAVGDESYIVQLLDITDLRAAQDELAHRALHDPLTGLANRALLMQELTRADVRRRRTGGTLCLLYCDLDGFKKVNDTHGHAAGDHLLSVVAERLGAAVRCNDVVARLGGDEFVILAEDLRVPDDATALAGRLLAAVTQPVQLPGGVTAVVGVSIGIAVASSEHTPHTLLRDADAALYVSKTEGRNRWTVHSAPAASSEQ